MNHRTKIYLLTGTSFLVGMAQFVITGILDQVAGAVGVSVAAAGQLVTAYALANALGTPLIMLLAARLDRRLLLLGALAALALGLTVTVALPSFGFLLAARALIGVASGVYSVTSFVLAAGLAPAGRQAGATSNLSMGYSASLIFGVPLGRWATAAFGWAAVFAALGLLVAVAFLVLFRTLPTTKGTPPAPLGQQVAYLKRPKVLLALAAAFTMFVGYSAGNTYVTPLLKLLAPGAEGAIGWLLMAVGAMSVLGSKLGGWFTDRFGLVPTVITGMAVQAVTMAVLIPAAGWPVAALGLLLVWAAAAWTCGPTLNLNLVRTAPEAAGILLSLNSSFVQLGFAAGAAVGGLGVAATGTAAAVPWIGAVSAVAATALISWSFAASPRRP